MKTVLFFTDFSARFILKEQIYGINTRIEYPMQHNTSISEKMLLGILTELRYITKTIYTVKIISHIMFLTPVFDISVAPDSIT